MTYWPQKNADCCGSQLEDPNFEARLPRVPTLLAVHQAGRYTRWDERDVNCSGDGIGKCSAGIAAVAFQGCSGPTLITRMSQIGRYVTWCVSLWRGLEGR